MVDRQDVRVSSVAWQLLPREKGGSLTHRWIKGLEERGKVSRKSQGGSRVQGGSGGS